MTADALTSLESLPLAEFVRYASAAPLEEEPESETGSGGQEARERLVRVHLRDVVDEAIAHRGIGVPIDTLVRRGLAGLVSASRQYDPRRHPAFADFARSRIRQAIREALFPH